jgi:predicted nucleic acid-binding protein
MSAIDYILCKASIKKVIEQLTKVNEKIKEKNEQHPWIKEHEDLMLDLTEAYSYILETDKEVTHLRSVNFNYMKLLIEKDAEMDKLKKENQEIGRAHV